MKNIGVITSRDNPKVKLAVKLKNSGRSRLENGLFVVEGLRLCCDAAASGYRYNILFITEDILNSHNDDIEGLISVSDEVYMVTKEIFSKISDTVSPQGVLGLAFFKKREFKVKKDGVYIALENIADPSNLGAISRSAEAFGIDGMIISKNGCDPFSPKALRASMGAFFRLPVAISEDFGGFLIEMKNEGLKVYSAVVEKTALSVLKVNRNGGSVIVIGNEANGITEATRNISDEKITITMPGRAESLNASVAAAVLMWEFVREKGDRDE